MATDNLKVNFSTEEVESTTKVFTAAPPGFYLAAITKVEDASVTSNDKGNFGKPYWKVTLVIQEGAFAKRWLFANVMLFEGALHTASQLLKAVGMGDLVKKGSIPPGHTLLGKTVEVNVVRVHDKYQEAELRKAGDTTSIFKNDVRGFRAPQAASSSSGSVLP